jgi:hypothetical protein
LDGVEGLSLDMHEGISDPAASRGCERWPKALRLVSSGGHFVPGRCRATNLCDYCAKLSAVENAEMLQLDALNGGGPALYVVLTTRSADGDPSSYYRSREQLQKAIRRRWPSAQLATLVEFTTGYAQHSGGVRRPHWNVLIKGVPVTELEAVRQLVDKVWCGREDSDPKAQYVGPVGDVGGIVGYLALHFQKADQTPPVGWSGHRFTYTHGYFGRPAWKVRREAQQSLRAKRALRRALDAGLVGQDAEEAAQQAVAVAEALRWECVVVSIDSETGVVSRARTLAGQEPKVMRVARDPDRFQRQAFLSGSLELAELVAVPLAGPPDRARQLALFIPRRD